MPTSHSCGRALTRRRPCPALRSRPAVLPYLPQGLQRQARGRYGRAALRAHLLHQARRLARLCWPRSRLARVAAGAAGHAGGGRAGATSGVRRAASHARLGSSMRERGVLSAAGRAAECPRSRAGARGCGDGGGERPWRAALHGSSAPWEQRSMHGSSAPCMGAALHADG